MEWEKVLEEGYANLLEIISIVVGIAGIILTIVDIVVGIIGIIQNMRSDDKEKDRWNICR